MKPGSRISGFYELPIEQRRLILIERGWLDGEDVARLAYGGLTVQAADGMVENAIGLHALPLGIGLNFLINGRDHLVAMATEEPSVIAAASNAARIVRGGGGFHYVADDSIMTTQIEIREVRDPAGATRMILAESETILAIARTTVPRLVARGGGPRALEVRQIDASTLVVHVHVDCLDAMGANLVNTLAEGVSDALCALAEGRCGLRILTNLSDRRCVRVEARIPVGLMHTHTHSGPVVAEGIAAASRFAELDPYRAATHNKGIMNGVDAVVLATGNDWRGVEAGAHAFAARTGRYLPLAVWHVVEDELVGKLEMPMAVGVVGGTSTFHAGARAALRLMDVRSASELAGIVGAAGLASNLAALRALATDGIQQGHMRMHRRAVESNVPLAASAPRQLDAVVKAIGDSSGQGGSGAIDGSRSERKCA
jgi:hydroxymethylglutaryl-CoA reductase